VLKTKTNSKPLNLSLFSSLPFYYFHSPTLKLKLFGQPTNYLEYWLNNLFAGNNLSMRGDKLSIRGIDLSIRGNNLSIGGKHHFTAENAFSIGGKHLSIGGKGFSISGKHLPIAGRDFTQPELK
jgi:hypothetical protein